MRKMRAFLLDPWAENVSSQNSLVVKFVSAYL